MFKSLQTYANRFLRGAFLRPVVSTRKNHVLAPQHTATPYLDPSQRSYKVERSRALIFSPLPPPKFSKLTLKRQARLTKRFLKRSGYTNAIKGIYLDHRSLRSKIEPSPQNVEAICPNIGAFQLEEVESQDFFSVNELPYNEALESKLYNQTPNRADLKPFALNEAFKTLQTMKEGGVVPSSQTYANLIRLCGLYDHKRNPIFVVDNAQDLYLDMFYNGIYPTSAVIESLMDVHLKEHNFEKMHDLFISATDYKLARTDKMHDLLLYCSSVRSDLHANTFQLFQSLQEEGLAVTPARLNCLIRSCATQGHVSGAHSILQLFDGFGLQPNVETSQILMETYATALSEMADRLQTAKITYAVNLTHDSVTDYLDYLSRYVRDKAEKEARVQKTPLSQDQSIVTNEQHLDQLPIKAFQINALSDLLDTELFPPEKEHWALSELLTRSKTLYEFTAAHLSNPEANGDFHTCSTMTDSDEYTFGTTQRFVTKYALQELDVPSSLASESANLHLKSLAASYDLYGAVDFFDETFNNPNNKLMATVSTFGSLVKCALNLSQYNKAMQIFHGLKINLPLEPVQDYKNLTVEQQEYKDLYITMIERLSKSNNAPGAIALAYELADTGLNPFASDVIPLRDIFVRKNSMYAWDTIKKIFAEKDQSNSFVNMEETFSLREKVSAPKEFRIQGSFRFLKY